MAFPRSKLKLFEDLDIPKAQLISGPEPLPSEIRFQPKTPEDDADLNEMFQIMLVPKPEFSIEELLTQLYVSHANAYNFEVRTCCYPVIIFRLGILA